MKTLKTIGLTLLVIVFVCLVLAWSVDHDKKVMEAGDKYAKCVLENYHQSVGQFYLNNGFYPTCE